MLDFFQRLAFGFRDKLFHDNKKNDAKQCIQPKVKSMMEGCHVCK